jgi:predicted RNA-binding Zn-ribbon protein involved in translation (DUF1610 family)
VSDAPKMFCGGCGADVTTPNSAGIYPCSKCGSTSRVSRSGPARFDHAFGNLACGALEAFDAETRRGLQELER